MPLLRDYAQDLSTARQGILRHLVDAEHRSMGRIARQLKITAPSYGFPALAKASIACETAIEARFPLAQINAAAYQMVFQIDNALATPGL